MITEFAIATGIVVLWNSRQRISVYQKWRRIMASDGRFTNKLGKSIKIWSFHKMYYGYDLITELPYSYTVADFKRDLDVFREALKLRDIEIKADSNVITMRCIKKYDYVRFEPMQLPGNKLLLCDGLVHPIIVNMNEFPHMLIGGDTGSGKSRLLLATLTNLINTHKDVDIFLLQLRKNDLEVFRNCRQIRRFANKLEDILEVLYNIDAECRRRESLIDATKGYYSIVEYNEEHADEKLKYMYVVIEEFSFLNTSRGDSKEEKDLKNKCLKHIKTLVNIGRAVGIFLITSLQKPTADSIPSDIKAQLTTRVSFKIKDAPAARVILGNEENTKLDRREVIVQTGDEEKGYSYTIDKNIIMQYIKDSISVGPATKKIIETVEPDELGMILDIINATNS